MKNEWIRVCREWTLFVEISDCCDGSDEWAGYVQCPNICQWVLKLLIFLYLLIPNCKYSRELGRKAREEAERRARVHREGYQKRQEMMKEGSNIRAEKKVVIDIPPEVVEEDRTDEAPLPPRKKATPPVRLPPPPQQEGSFKPFWLAFTVTTITCVALLVFVRLVFKRRMSTMMRRFFKASMGNTKQYWSNCVFLFCNWPPGTLCYVNFFRWGFMGCQCQWIRNKFAFISLSLRCVPGVFDQFQINCIWSILFCRFSSGTRCIGNRCVASLSALNNGYTGV